MARKSRWQQFADSFNATYGTFNNAFKNIESTRAMDKDYKDDEGNVLEGSALESARYKALGDIYTKYGDAEGGLMMRGRYADLQSAQMGNKITRETMDDQIAAAGLGNDLTRARIDSANASTARSRAATANSVRSARKPTQAEIIQRALQDAMTGAAPSGEGTAPPPASSPAPTGDSPVNRTAPAAPNSSAAPGGLTPPSAPSSLPQVSSAAPDEDVQVARAAARSDVNPNPVISTQGRAGQQEGPGAPQPRPDEFVGGSGGDTLDSAKSPDAMTAAPNMAQMTEKLAEGVAAGGKNKTKATREVASQGRASAEDVMMRAAENLLNSGQVDAAKKLVQGVETYGAIEALKITRDSERLRQGMNVALRRGGVGGALAVLDQYNGEDLKVDVIQTEDGFSVVEYMPGEGDDPGAQRALFSGRTAEEIEQGFITYTMDPVESADYTAKILANKKAKAELEMKRKKIPGSDANERAINFLAAEPNNPRARLLAEVVLGLPPEQIDEFVVKNQIYQDARSANTAPPPGSKAEPKGTETPDRAEAPREDQNSSAARVETRGVGGTGGGDATGQRERRANANLARGGGGLRDTGPSETPADRARSIALDVWRRAEASRQAGPSGLASSPSAGNTNSEAIMARVYGELARDPMMSEVSDRDLRTLAREAVMSAAQ